MVRIILFVIFISFQKCSSLSPVILVPGDGGSQFEAKLNKATAPHFWCSKSSPWFPIWLNMELIVPEVLDCLVDNMRLVYDPKTHTTHDSPGVQIRVPGFGNTSTVEWLDSSEFSQTSYFYHIAQGIVTGLNYTRNVNIRGAPFDFRKAPNELGPFFIQLKALVENTYKINGNKKVVFIGHSMGNTVTLYFLNHQSQTWKDKYVKSFLALSAPFGGAVKSLRVMASGDSLGVFIVNPLKSRPMQQSMPSSAYFLPYEQYFKKDTILVYTPTRNYTIHDYKQLFTDMNYPTGYLMRQDTENLGLKDLVHPGVEVHCLHGINVTTPAAFKYGPDEFPDAQPTVIPGNGDGTVNVESLYTCLKWKGGKQPFYHKEFTGPSTDHLGFLANVELIKYVVSYLGAH